MSTTAIVYSSDTLYTLKDNYKELKGIDTLDVKVLNGMHNDFTMIILPTDVLIKLIDSLYTCIENDNALLLFPSTPYEKLFIPNIKLNERWKI